MSTVKKKTTLSIEIDHKTTWFFIQVILVILKLGGVLNISWWLI